MAEIKAPSMRVPGSFTQTDNDCSFRCAPFNSSLFLPPTKECPPSTSPFTRHPRPQATPNSGGLLTQTRKRARVDHRDDDAQTPSNNLFGISRNNFFDEPSPAPFVSTDYRFAGGVATPADLNAQRAAYERECEYENEYRPNRYGSQQPPSHHPTGSYFPQTPSIPQTGDNLSQSDRNGWRKSVWALTGTVAGKVFNFCWQGATSFKGFYAGGGNGYNFDVGTPAVTSKEWTEVNPQEDVFHHDYDVPRRRRERDSTPVPGEFPSEQPEFVEDYTSQPWKYSNNNDDTPTARPGIPPARNSWVVVNGPSTESRDTSPVRKKSRASVAPLSASARSSPRNLNSNSSLIARPRLSSRSSGNKSSASVASPRASLATGENGHGHTKSRAPLSTSASLVDGTTRRQSNRASLASPRRQSSNSVSVPVVGAQPSPEVRKFEQKMRRKEAKEDESMRRLNERLKAMITEGKQALGSKIEIVDDGGVDEEIDYDEGFVDGEEAWEREYVRPMVWS
ncbi:hypothetical protein LTR84_004845 [Exophiala bonariae]|uniref:Uncharacterized protein n=1 Tax=Exophiala bonariae TaxID=1690606 RepID=A0AAV9NNJ3_9EURO|nr:hypothetical protein LTR84_004845 [Exophiala bonariae]